MVIKKSMKNDFNVYASVERHEMLRFVPESAETILDVGCSVGNFGEMLKAQRSAEVWGVEIDEDAAKIASQKLDKVFNDSFDEKLNLPEKKFDCIVFNDVLEHMIDPYSALEYAKKLLTENGVVVASIPNVRFFSNVILLMVHKNWEYVDSGILDRTHLRFFTKKSIESTFTQQNYSIEQLTGINPLEETDTHYVRKFKILNFLTLGHIEDMRWLQYAVVAKPKPDS